MTSDGFGHGQDSVAATDAAVDRHGAVTVADEAPTLQLQVHTFLVCTPSIGPNLINFDISMPARETAAPDAPLGSANQTLYAGAGVDLAATWHDRRGGSFGMPATTEMSLSTSRGVADTLRAGDGADEASLAPGHDEGTSAAADAPMAMLASPGRLLETVGAIWDGPAAMRFEDWTGNVLATGAGSDGLLFGSILIFAGVTVQELTCVPCEWVTEPESEAIRRRRGLPPQPE